MTKLLWYVQMGYAVLFLALAVPHLHDRLNYVSSSHQLVFMTVWIVGLIAYRLKKRWSPLLLMAGAVGLFANYVSSTHFFWFSALRYPRFFPYLVESHQLLPHLGLFLGQTLLLGYPAAAFAYFLLRDGNYPSATRQQRDARG